MLIFRKSFTFKDVQDFKELKQRYLTVSRHLHYVENGMVNQQITVHKLSLPTALLNDFKLFPLRSQPILIGRDGVLPGLWYRGDADVKIAQQVRAKDDFLPFAIPSDMRVFATTVSAVAGCEQMRAGRLAFEQHDVAVRIVGDDPAPIAAAGRVPPVQTRGLRR